jgi:hypothetical protein
MNPGIAINMFSLLKNQILISALIAEIGAATPAKI